MLDITSPLEMALAYAEKGWAVFPLYRAVGGVCNCWKAARGENCGRDSAKHPRIDDGFKGATTDGAKIRRWFEMWPESNIGIATGVVSGIFVVDIDPDSGGNESFDKLRDEGKHFPDSPVVRTQRGGWHLYYAHPGRLVRCSAGAIAKGIDIRGDGGYVVAPPSVGVRGSYVWQRAIPIEEWMV